MNRYGEILRDHMLKHQPRQFRQLQERLGTKEALTGHFKQRGEEVAEQVHSQMMQLLQQQTRPQGESFMELYRRTEAARLQAESQVLEEWLQPEEAPSQ
jgi:hypothetical protein